MGGGGRRKDELLIKSPESDPRSENGERTLCMNLVDRVSTNFMKSK